jgi:hypothetical protein
MNNTLLIVSASVAAACLAISIWTRIVLTAFAISGLSEALRRRSGISQDVATKARRVSLSIAAVWVVLFALVSITIARQAHWSGWIWLFGTATLVPLPLLVKFLTALRRQCAKPADVAP